MISRRAVFLLFLLVAGLGIPSGASAAARGKNSDLVIQGWEKWIDTVRGRVKNFGPATAHDVTVMVDFRDSKGKVVGRKAAVVGILKPGEEGTFEVEIPEKLRNVQAVTYKFSPHALWR